MNRELIRPILASPELPQLLQSLQTAWEEEQAKRHAFWAEVDEGKKAEFIQGEIIYHSPVYGRHWMISTNLVRKLVPFVYDNRLGKVGIEKVMIRLTRNDYEPDICFWSKEKAQAFTAKQSAFPPPDFVVEILSDSTRERDRGIKFEDYARHGISEYWLIDPEAETIEQYLLQGETYGLSVKLKSGRIEAQAIPDFGMDLADIFYFEE